MDSIIKSQFTIIKSEFTQKKIKEDEIMGLAKRNISKSIAEEILKKTEFSDTDRDFDERVIEHSVYVRDAKYMSFVDKKLMELWEAVSKKKQRYYQQCIDEYNQNLSKWQDQKDGSKLFPANPISWEDVFIAERSDINSEVLVLKVNSKRISNTLHMKWKIDDRNFEVQVEGFPRGFEKEIKYPTSEEELLDDIHE